MANDRLRAVLHRNGFSEARFAEELGVDMKTVQRWITQNRCPHRTTAHRAAKLLDVPLLWLWPDLEAQAEAATTEVVGFYPHRADAPKQLWLELLLSVSERLDILTNASLFLPEDNPESIDLIRQKAESGIPVRIAMGDPDSRTIELRGWEEKLYDGLIGRVRMALAYFRPLVGIPGVTFHLHQTALYNSIFRYDDQMLVNQHALGIYGYLAPVLHLRRVEGADLFDTYMRSYERAWEESYPYRPEENDQASGVTGRSPVTEASFARRAEVSRRSGRVP